MTKDGGPAFPQSVESWRNSGVHKDIPAVPSGMSLRDWFAGKALAGMLANRDTVAPNGDHRPVLAMVAYEMADAMLKAREQKP